MKNIQKDWEDRQGRSPRQVEDSEVIMTWTLSIGFSLLIIWVLVYHLIT